tara:strand:+ start:208 stop:657 length:450 start_codon:yes stop_codon:yes gene_type:complete
MLNFKVLIFIGSMIFISHTSVAQELDKSEVDQRIVANIGEQEAMHAYVNRRDYYEFLKFELNETCTLISASSLPVNSQVKHDISFLEGADVNKIQEKIEAHSFNPKAYNLPQLKEQDVYVRLEGDIILVIKSTMNIKRAFLATGLQNKK